VTDARKRPTALNRPAKKRKRASGLLVPPREPGFTEEGFLWIRLTLAVLRLNGGLVAAGDRITKGLGLTSARWQILAVPAQEDATVAQIARMQGLQRQSVWRIVNLLLAEGMIEFVDNPDHRRAKLVRLTSLGAEKHSLLLSREVAWANSIDGAVTTQELSRMIDVLLVLLDHVEARIGEP